MKIITASTFLSLSFCFAVSLHADSFGSGVNQFDIEFVGIGNPDNPDDTTGNPNPAGKVEYAFRMGKFEISEDMIDKANSLGGLGITHDNRGANKPATSVSKNEAARFVNWLNESTGHSPAYKISGRGGDIQLWQPGDAGYNPANLFRNQLARYVLPSVDEWYKAAYFDPIAEVYYDYPTGSDGVPDGIDFAGDTVFQAVFTDGGSNLVPNDITDVGILSPYGTAGQGGNVREWEETEYDLTNDSVSSAPAVRGGEWLSFSSSLLSSSRGFFIPQGGSSVGFRVASIPEPSAMLIGAFASLGLLSLRIRYRMKS